MTASTSDGAQPHRHPASAHDPASARDPAGVRDPALDGLRGLAVLLVYLFHYGGGLKSHHLLVRLFGLLTAAGWTGVELFFALSGFLITGILWDSMRQPRPRHRLRNFYARRILRIFPLYYATLALCAIILLATGYTFVQVRMIYVYAFFLQDLPGLSGLAQQVPTLPLYHFWSLAVEEQFYLLWPFLLLLAPTRRAALRLCLGAFAASFAFCAAVFGLPHLFSIQSAQSLDSFLLTHAGALALGSAAAIALRASASSAEHAFFNRFALPAFLLGLAAYLTSSLFCHTLTLAPRLQFVLGLPAVSLAAAASIPLVLRSGLPRRLCSLSALRFMGRISYGFYVFHLLLQPIFDAIGLHFAHAASGQEYLLLRMIAGFPITLAVSWVSYQLLEVPFLQLKRFFPLKPALPAS